MADTLKKYRVYIIYTINANGAVYKCAVNDTFKAKYEYEAQTKAEEKAVGYYEGLLKDIEQCGYTEIHSWDWTKTTKRTFKEFMTETTVLKNFTFQYNVTRIDLMYDYGTEPVEVCMRDLTLEEYNELLDTLGIKNCPMIRSIQ